jgi:hypothetical protein
MITLLVLGIALCLAIAFIGESDSATRSRFLTQGQSLLSELKGFANSCLELLKNAYGRLISRFRRPPSTPE